MRKRQAVITFFWLFLLLNFNFQWVVAQEEDPAPGEAAETEGTYTTYGDANKYEGKGLDELVSLDLRNIEVTEALRFLAMKAYINLAVSSEVSGRLMLLLNDVPIRDVLDIILLTNSLAYDKKGDIFNIMTEEEYRLRYGRKFSDTRKIKIFKLSYAVPEQVFSIMDALKSEVGRILVDQDSGTALIMDTEENLMRIQEAVNALEQKQALQVFPLQYAKAEDIQEQLKPHLDDKKAGSIMIDERSNQVVIQTLPERMNVMGELIKSLDKKTKEVLIVAKIIKVSATDDFNAEIKWEGFFKRFDVTRTDQEFFGGNHPRNALARTGQSFVDDFVSIAPTTRPTAGSKNEVLENLLLGFTTDQGEITTEVLLNFLRKIGDTKVLSTPRITVVNNQEALIHVGEREAYVTTTTTTGQSTSTIAEQVTFIDIGIKLAVTPTINDQGFVTMKIKPEISSVARFLTTPSKNTIPIVDTSIAETTVMVKDGTSILIAGLRRNDRTDTDKRVPFLGDIPLLGKLFRSYSNTKKRSDLLIILTPHIVDGVKLVTGEPSDDSVSGMKPYQDYSDLAVEPAKKSEWSHSLWGFFKGILLLGRD